MSSYRTLPEFHEMSAEAMALHTARHAGDPAALERIRRSYPFPRLKGRSDEELLAEFFTKVDAHQVIAAEYGFGHWGELTEYRDRDDDPDFEAAVDAVVEGELAALEELLDRRPELVHARSACLHRQTLLHYVAANGCEEARQKTPRNAVDIARALLERGAEVDALSCIYDGRQTNTTLYLLVSSDHPKRAGVQRELVELLLEHGAAADGLDGDGLPLGTAIAFHSPEAMDALRHGGARVDNVVFAAALGALDELAACFEGERLKPERRGRSTQSLEVPDGTRGALDVAVVHAAKFGRLEALEFLLAHGGRANARLDLDQSGLHWASFYGHLDVVERLVEAGADSTLRDRRFNASPLGWAQEGEQEAVIAYLSRVSDS